jgi:WD40 repeat protein
MRWHPKGHALAVGTAEGQVWLFFISSPTSFNIMSVASISSEAVTQCRFTADGKNLIASAHDGSISCWDPKDMGKPVWKADLSLDGRWHEGSVLSFDLIHSTENQQQQVIISFQRLQTLILIYRSWCLVGKMASVWYCK